MVAGQEPIHVIYRKGNCQRPKIVILLHLVSINQHSNSRSYSMSEAAQALALFICGQCMQHLDYLLEDATTAALQQGTLLFYLLVDSTVNPSLENGLCTSSSWVVYRAPNPKKANPEEERCLSG
jgi:hypothetical protein